MGWQGGVLVALVSALVGNLGSLWRQRGAQSAPDVDVRTPVKTVVGLFTSKWWTIGYAAAFIAWLLHIGALAIAPLSIVQASLSAGFVFLALLADRFFDIDLGTREWIGVVLASVGLAFLALSAGDVNGTQSTYTLAPMLAFELALAGIGALLILTGRRRGLFQEKTGVLLGAAAGVLFTVTHVALKALTKHFDSPLDLVSPWPLIAVAGGVVAFFASARSLQIGPAVPVIAITSIVGNATSIAAGVVVFGDPIGEGPMVVARVAAFLMVVIVAALIPGPIHRKRERQLRRSRDRGTAPASA